ARSGRGRFPGAARRRCAPRRRLLSSACFPLRRRLLTPTSPLSPLSPLEARWLAEVVRRHEDRNGLLEDSAALLAARAAPPELDERILRRADVLGEREGWREAIRRWHGRARLGLLAAAVFALVFGFGAAAGVLGDGSRPVNVVWAL